MKKIIFDIDNTLIEWKDEYVSSIMRLLSKYRQYTKEDGIEIYNRLSYYGDNLLKLDIDDLVNRFSDLNISKEFLLDILESQKECSEPAKDEIIDTLEYLSKKYELVILSNWFKEVQIQRMKKAKIYKYFKAIYCNDEYVSKPNKEAFLNALGTTSPSEAVMIGDNLDIDILPAISIGINGILITSKEIKSDKFTTIKNISKLKELL